MTKMQEREMVNGRCPYCHGAGVVFFEHVADKRKQRTCPLCFSTGHLRSAQKRIANGVAEAIEPLGEDDRFMLENCKAAVVAFTLANELEN